MNDTDENIDTEFIDYINTVKKRCRRDAEKGDFKKTDALISNLTELAIHDKDPKLREIYRLIVVMITNYKKKVITGAIRVSSGIYGQIQPNTPNNNNDGNT